MYLPHFAKDISKTSNEYSCYFNVTVISFKNLINRARNSNQCYATGITDTALWSIFFFYFTGVSNAWLETLLAAIEALPKETIRHEVMLFSLKY